MITKKEKLLNFLSREAKELWDHYTVEFERYDNHADLDSMYQWKNTYNWIEEKRNFLEQLIGD